MENPGEFSGGDDASHIHEVGTSDFQAAMENWVLTDGPVSTTFGGIAQSPLFFYTPVSAFLFLGSFCVSLKWTVDLLLGAMSLFVQFGMWKPGMSGDYSSFLYQSLSL